MGKRALSFDTCRSTVSIPCKSSFASGQHFDQLLMPYIGVPGEACGPKELMSKHQRSIRGDMLPQHVPSPTNYATFRSLYNLISWYIPHEGLRGIKIGFHGKLTSEG
jgi:hypothetical protein